jgi:serine/threonine protein kinase
VQVVTFFWDGLMSRELVLGKYQIERVLGKGAMGVVFGAFDPTVARKVAIKTIRKDLLSDDGEDGDILERFNREARAAARLNHPNVVTIYELGEDNDLAYIAMEFIVGESLQDITTRQGRLPVVDAIRVANQLLDALDYAHQHNVIHRDIKPANIMIDTKGLLKVTDFGIARIDASELTQLGTVMGSPSYMAPEQIKGLVVDGRADLFSAAVVLFEILTGQRPFTGSIATVMDKVVNAPHPRPSTLNLALPDTFNGLFDRALAKQPSNRFGTGKEFREALRVAALAIPSRSSGSDSDTLVEDFATPLDTPVDAPIFSMQFSKEELGLSAVKEKLSQEIEAFSQAFDPEVLKKLEQENAREKVHWGVKFPELTTWVDGVHATAEEEQKLATALPVPGPENEGGLLQRLKREASAKQALDGQRASLHIRQKRRISESLQTSYHYLREFCESLNILKPVRPCTYSILNVLRIESPPWQTGSADFRETSDSTCGQLFDQVTVRLRLGQGEEISIERENPSHMIVRNSLFDNNITFKEAEVRNERHHTILTRFTITCDVKVEVRLVADYERGDIRFVQKNLQRFGSSEFRFMPEMLTQEALEELANLLLGQESRFEAMCRQTAQLG